MGLYIAVLAGVLLMCRGLDGYIQDVREAYAKLRLRLETYRVHRKR